MMQRMEHLSDNELLRLVRQNPDAFGVFYERHAATLVGTLRYRTGSTELAFDLAAETFAAALEGVDRYKPSHDDSALAWLYTIARNKLADYYRSGELQTAARQRLALEPIVLDDDRLERIEARIDAAHSAVLAALERLPPQESEALQARIVGDQSYAAIAAHLDVSEPVVRQRVSRGLRRLRMIVKDQP